MEKEPHDFDAVARGPNQLGGFYWETERLHHTNVVILHAQQLSLVGAEQTQVVDVRGETNAIQSSI